MLGTESCWCCPACNKTTKSYHPKTRRRERQVSFNGHSNSLSPSKRQACSLPERSSFPIYSDSDCGLAPPSLEACTECAEEQESHLTITLEGGTQIMCLRCQRKKSRNLTTSLPFSPSSSPTPAMLAVDQRAILQDMDYPPNGAYQNGVLPIDNGAGDEVQSLFVDAFLHNNRLEHMVQVMGYHPKYLEAFLKAQDTMLRGDGPLPYDYRHYIAIMASGRHQCSYLIHIQSREFILQGGDASWLKGLEHVPQKLQDLYEINKILAHRPWLLTKGHLEKLTRGQDNWSISELMHAIIILTHFHALCSFVYGCGINAELDSEEGHTLAPPSPGATASAAGSVSPGTSPGARGSGSSQEEGGGIEQLMEKMKRLNEETPEEMTQEELQKRFEKIETQTSELPAASKQPSPRADVLRYVQDPDFTYQDFAKRGYSNSTGGASGNGSSSSSSSDIPTFRVQDYSWEEQGFTLANRLYNNIGKILDKKFAIAKDLTYYTMGDRTEVDTSSFRRSIWNYIHCMFGIRHDDFDYSEVNQLLERALKSYVKTVTCYPERITRKDYDSFMREFKHSEKVHVNLMLLEARMQAELLYALRAIMKHMT